MEHFKQELLEYLDCCTNRRNKAKLKGLPPAFHRQQALSAAYEQTRKKRTTDKEPTLMYNHERIQ